MRTPQMSPCSDVDTSNLASLPTPQLTSTSPDVTASPDTPSSRQPSQTGDASQHSPSPPQSEPSPSPLDAGAVVDASPALPGQLVVSSSVEKRVAASTSEGSRAKTKKRRSRDKAKRREDSDKKKKKKKKKKGNTGKSGTSANAPLVASLSRGVFRSSDSHASDEGDETTAQANVGDDVGGVGDDDGDGSSDDGDEESAKESSLDTVVGRSATPRSNDKRKRSTEGSAHSEVDSSDASDEETGGRAWNPKKFKRLRRAELPEDHHLVQKISDYKRGRNGAISTVEVVWAHRGKNEAKTSWIRASALVDIKHWQLDFDRIDAFKKSGRKSMNAFLQSKEGEPYRAPIQLGADDDNLSCGYTAVGVVLGLLNIPNPVTREKIAAFREAGAKRRKLVTQTSGDQDNQGEPVFSGVRWNALRTFIRQLDLIDMDVVGRNLYTGMGSGVKALKNLKLTDGIYLVGGFSPAKGGHVFVVEVTAGGQHLAVHEKDEIEDVNWLHDWLQDVSFVRRVESKKH